MSSKLPVGDDQLFETHFQPCLQGHGLLTKSDFEMGGVQSVWPTLTGRRRQKLHQECLSGYNWHFIIKTVTYPRLSTFGLLRASLQPTLACLTGRKSAQSVA